ncbi:MAG: right-handed parallel beta-helix repeat-containing protein [Gammaproteobacteria bacterium]
MKMKTLDRRLAWASALLLALGVLAGLGFWYDSTGSNAVSGTENAATLSVTSAADQGPGSLREALFLAASAEARTTIVVQVDRIEITTPLPPLVSPHGIGVVAAPESHAEIDAHALTSGPVFDVNGPNSSIKGLTIRNCPEAGVLLRASRFRMESTNIEACDVGVDVADNAADMVLEQNQFARNRVGVRLAASIPNALVAGNHFNGNSDAGLWAVHSEPDLRESSTIVRDNEFRDDRMGIVAGNLSMLVEENMFLDIRETAIHLIGEGLVVRANRISGTAAMGIVAENARSVVIEKNELDGLSAYGIMVRGSANTLLRANLIHNCAYGMAFVLGDEGNPSTAVDNSIVAPQYRGIDVIGESPILRHNRVQQAGNLPLHVESFRHPDGTVAKADPFREGNSFDEKDNAAAAAHSDPSPAPAGASRPLAP